MQLWLIELDDTADALERLEACAGLLSDEERSWVTAAEHQRRRRLARIALRLLLARWGAVGARRVPLGVGSHGKPHLGPGQPGFNCSHSGGCALIAIAAGGCVGVDIETQRAASLGPERRALIEAAGGALADRRDDPVQADGHPNAAFLAAWTRLEAYAKARGDGVGRVLTELGITAQGVRTSSSDHVAATARRLIAASGLEVRSLAMPDRLYGAVCGPRGAWPAGSRPRRLDAGECRLP